MSKTVLKPLTCPNCQGEVSLDKNQEFGFCKYCGTKVQNVAIKKIRGKVKIDKNDELDNYYVIARRAINDNDDETAEKYYDMILQIDPNSYEALFYKTYCSASNCKIIQIRNSIIKVNNCLDSVYKLLNDEPDENRKKEMIKEISNKANSIFITLVNGYSNYYDEIDYEIRNNYNQEYIDVFFAGFQAEEYMSDLLLKYFPNDKWVKDNVGTLLKNANDWHIRCIPKLANKELNIEQIHKRTEKIKKYNPDYVEPNISTGGCYIATCVYGSYNCPEVWTLRRYRDQDLAKTWYGRLFIHIYYAISPTVVRLFGDTKWFKAIWKNKLDKKVKKLREQGYQSTPYDDINWQ